MGDTTNYQEYIVADHLVQSFIKFAGASYTWYVNICSGTIGDR